ncbi:hypothetical protein [Lysobacter sp. CA199]|uniref:hypothetical protein n=1 Tax=Lysobacter sp. CA199 TaxID=3455608 RepID=UPI003F8D01B0
MARTKNPTVAAIEPAQTALAETAQQQNQMAVISGQIAEEFGDGLPYDRSRYIEKARWHMQRSAEEALEVGRCLLVMKECEPHGEFLTCLQSLGMEPRLSQRMMQAAVRFSNASTSTHLVEAAKSKSKLFELMVLDDDDLDALSSGGSVAGLKLDDVERMSVSELRAALRKSRQSEKDSEDTHSRLLAKKDERINQLDRKLAQADTAKRAPNRQEADRQDAESALLAKLQNSAMKLYGEITPFAQDVADCLEGAPSESFATAVTTTVQWLFQRINEVALAHTIPVDFAEVVTPSWMGDLLNQSPNSRAAAGA